MGRIGIGVGRAVNIPIITTGTLQGPAGVVEGECLVVDRSPVQAFQGLVAVQISEQTGHRSRTVDAGGATQYKAQLTPGLLLARGTTRGGDLGVSPFRPAPIMAMFPTELRIYIMLIGDPGTIRHPAHMVMGVDQTGADHRIGAIYNRFIASRRQAIATHAADGPIRLHTHCAIFVDLGRP